ncbi:MAG: PEPxxWA-CTERM sorting domain-containing protein [Phenylobacterium sp.]|nr:PEPxxWA-CTERM sorting domain-containing protein [Phenylobacterium sp.]
MKLGLLVATAFAVATPALAGTVAFNDSAMDLGGYSFTTYADPGFVTSISDGGGSISTSYQKTGVSSPAPKFQALNSSFVYDPSVQGEISSLDASLDLRLSMFHDASTVTLTTAPIQLRVLAEQDGSVYQALRVTGTGMPFNAFFNSTATGILESEFLLFDPANPFAPRTLTGLDFGGGAITFGFELSHFGVLVGGLPSTGLVRSTFGADNFALTLHTLDPTGAVPEPQTWALLIGGFGLAGAALRRTRRIATA